MSEEKIFIIACKVVLAAMLVPLTIWLWKCGYEIAKISGRLK